MFNRLRFNTAFLSQGTETLYMPVLNLIHIKIGLKLIVQHPHVTSQIFPAIIGGVLLL